jgi:hypothetical protein
MQILDHGLEKTLAFIPNQQGELTIWQRPQAGRFYFAGVDIAQGIDRAGSDPGRSDPDYTWMPIFELESGIQAAEYRARSTPATAARECAAIAKWYNWAFLIPEATGIGTGFLEQLLDVPYPMERIYQRTRLADDLKEPRLEELGWWTDAQSRWQMIALLESYLRSGRLQMRSALMRQEFHTFVVTARGKPEGMRGCHDDGVMAAALTAAGLEQAAMLAAMRKVQSADTALSVPYGGIQRQVEPYKRRRV